MRPLRVANLGERRLLDRFLPVLGRRMSKEVVVGPGDDAAVVRGDGHGNWVVTTDMMVENVHFRARWTSGYDLGYKALAMNLSDLAAMGNVAPVFGVVSLGISGSTSVGFVDKFYAGLRHLADRSDLSIVGGDTVRSERIVVSVTAVGKVSKRSRVVLRSGAKIGDEFLVTGTVGDAAAGLKILESGKRYKGARDRYLVSRFLRPEPRLRPAVQLSGRPGLNALMDSSDGLWISVSEICRASAVGARIDAEKLPVSGQLRNWSERSGEDPLDLALIGGEDYELVMTADPATARFFEAKGWARSIGRVVPRSQGCNVYFRGDIRRIPHGYEHFN